MTIKCPLRQRSAQSQFKRLFFGEGRQEEYIMGEEHNVVFGQGPKVNKAKSTPTSPSICLMRHLEGEVSVLLALLTLGPCPKTTLCSSPIGFKSIAHREGPQKVRKPTLVLEKVFFITRRKI